MRKESEALMKALVWNTREVLLEVIEKPQTSPSDSLVRVRLAGICNTDKEIVKGYTQFNGVLGHEFVGVVEESGDPFWVGKRVVCDINCACRECPVCHQEEYHHCPNRKVIGILNKNGAFAEYISVPTSNLYEVPDTVSDEQAVFAEPLAAALEILDQCKFRKGIPVCVVGDGKLGLIITMVLCHYGLKVTLLGRHPERKKILRSFDVNYCCETPGISFPLVVEVTGNPEGFRTAIELVSPRGTVVLKSTFARAFTFNPASVVVNEVNVLGSRCGPMDVAVTMLKTGKLNLKSLIDYIFPLNSGLKAIRKASEKGVLKVLIQC